jgi:DNA-binding transcriptional LysR family regulator
MAAHLNTRLLVRSTRKLTLTDAGAAYLAACRRILEQVGDAERVVAAHADLGQVETAVVVQRVQELSLRRSSAGPSRPSAR